MRIYKGKSKLRIQIDTKCDLSGYQAVTIAALKANGDVVEFPAVVKNVEKGIIFYDVQSENDFDVSGWWWLWPESSCGTDEGAHCFSGSVQARE